MTEVNYFAILRVKPEEAAKLYSQFTGHFERRLTREALDKISRGEVSTVLVARVNGEVIGITGLFMSDRGVLSGFTVVLREFRNVDIGTALLRERYRLEPDCDSIVAEDNFPSLRMCEKVGLTQVGEQIAPNGKKCIVFRKVKKDD